jgi:hypothetical protein
LAIIPPLVSLCARRGALSGVMIVSTPGAACAAARSKPAISPLAIVLCTSTAWARLSMSNSAA